MGDNIAKGVEALIDSRPVLICLADMPFVSISHVGDVLAAANSVHSVVASALDDILCHLKT